MAHPPVDFVALALGSPRGVFVAAAPYTFIISDGSLPRNSGPHRVVLAAPELVVSTLDSPPAVDRTLRPFLALALRKVSDTFPQMITLGRTGNNDLVVTDASISKVHAFFSHSPARGFELADAGSTNGTWVGGKQLVSRGAAVGVRVGERLRVGRIEFTVVDGGTCWDTIDRMRR